MDFGALPKRNISCDDSLAFSVWDSSQQCWVPPGLPLGRESCPARDPAWGGVHARHRHGPALRATSSVLPYIHVHIFRIEEKEYCQCREVFL